MGIEKAYFQSLETDPLNPEVAEVFRGQVSHEDCEDHFKGGPKIMPAFRMLGKFIERVSDQSGGALPKHVRMVIGDILPQDANYTETLSPPDPFYSAYTLVINREKDITITGEAGSLSSLSPFIPDSEQPFNFDDGARLLTKYDIEGIIPQGSSIQFIDGIINPSSPDVISEGIHKITLQDYVETDGAPLYHFDFARGLEGFGQLAYVHFQKTLQPKEPMIPFFREVEIDFNLGYCPGRGEVVHYQLTKFETDFAERGDKGSGIIEGRILAGDLKTPVAIFTAKVGAMRQRVLEYVVQKITAEAAKKQSDIKDELI